MESSAPEEPPLEGAKFFKRACRFRGVVYFLTMIRTTSGILVLLAAATFGAGREMRAELKLNGLFGDGMVLQRGVPCPVWGTAGPGDVVTVSIVGKYKTVKAKADGRWSVKLDPLSA